MSGRLGYVVIEWNQASGVPEIADDYLTDDREYAEHQADRMHDEARRMGRRETYAVGTVYIEEEE